MEDHFTLHIRGVGHWTNRLYELVGEQFESEETPRRSLPDLIGEAIKIDFQIISETMKERRENKNVDDCMDKDKDTQTRKLDFTAEDSRQDGKYQDSILRHFRERNERSEYNLDITVETRVDITIPEPLQIYVDGPFGSPSSNIYRAQHAVLIGTGIGKTVKLWKYHRYTKVFLHCRHHSIRFHPAVHHAAVPEK